eukprot:1644039-Alexandrium_andersonii.AAC.1
MATHGQRARGMASHRGASASRPQCQPAGERGLPNEVVDPHAAAHLAPCGVGQPLAEAEGWRRSPEVQVVPRVIHGVALRPEPGPGALAAWPWLAL